MFSWTAFLDRHEFELTFGYVAIVIPSKHLKVCTMQKQCRNAAPECVVYTWEWQAIIVPLWGVQLL